MRRNSEADENKKKVRASQVKQMKKVVAVASSNAEGIILLRHIMDLCGFTKFSVTMNPQTQEVNDKATLYNEARRNVWLEIRNLIPVTARKKIEYEKTIFLEEEDG